MRAIVERRWNTLSEATMSAASMPMLEPTAALLYDPLLTPGGPLLVASDGTASADPAFVVAHALAERQHTTVQVISALRPAAMPAFAADGVPFPVAPTDDMIDARNALVKTQMERAVPATLWPVTVRAGDPIREILDVAKSLDARCIVTGRGRHSWLERMFSGESVMRLLQLGEVPVFAVEKTLTGLPRTVVIATDFSVFGTYAAQVALDYIAPDAHVHLVHVAPPLSDNGPVLGAFAEEYHRAANGSFRQLLERLERKGLQFETHILEGNTASQLVDYANSMHADLVVTGTHGYGFARRLVLGSVATSLVRGVSCSVLCVPGSARTHAAARAVSQSAQIGTHIVPSESLDHALDTFTTRNASRVCSVEVERRDIGTQMLGHHLPLVGLTYDRDAALLTVMFGASQLEGAHLSHVIPRVTAVDIVRDAQGRDRMLRIMHKDGQTLLMLE